ncbi:MAG: alcohol dehydrogenase catalytic domain-containing protein [Nitrospirae bacterium]|nr:alcohol dehydrogenase catalytic domain-containing protein [Nitrospirota bacterium]
MRALLFKNGLSYLNDYPAPVPTGDEALIRVSCAGICNTDIEILRGYMGFSGIPGHEFAGVVEKSPDNGLVGKRVTGEINVSCGTCSYCQIGLKNHCPNRSVLGILNRNGALADYLILPVSNLHIIPDSVSDEEAVFAEPLAAAFEIMEQVQIRPEDKVCVLGDGKLGLLIAQVLSLSGCELIVAGRHRDKLSILENRGIRTTPEPPANERVFDIVVDATGSPSGLEAALNIVRPRGRIIIKTTVAERGAVDLNRVVIDELTLIGSRCGPFPPAIKALEAKSVDVRPLVSRVFPIEEGIRAFQYAAARGVLKVLLKFN